MMLRKYKLGAIDSNFSSERPVGRLQGYFSVKKVKCIRRQARANILSSVRNLREAAIGRLLGFAAIYSDTTGIARCAVASITSPTAKSSSEPLVLFVI